MRLRVRRQRTFMSFNLVLKGARRMLVYVSSTLFALLVFFQVSQLAVAQENTAQVTGSQIIAPAAVLNDTRYRIGPGDVLTIIVRKAPELSLEAVRVDQRGMIRIPMIEGELTAAF